MKKIGLMIFGSDEVLLYKDPGMILYSLAEEQGWNADFIYPTDGIKYISNDAYEQYVNLVCVGECHSYKEWIKACTAYIKEKANEYDVMMFFNYGHVNWRFAKLCKKYNPHIKVYCKLDMSESGFRHFCDGSLLRPLKNLWEKYQSRYVDFFTVETKSYYEALKTTSMFKDRIGYLPNGVSLLGTRVNWRSEKLQEKEKIVITVGRLGAEEKNNKLLVDAIAKLPFEQIKDWKFYFVGAATDSFREYVDKFKKAFPLYAENVIMYGNVTDRDELYRLYHKASIVCMTSKRESFGIATVEGTYFGCVPVLTNYGKVVSDVTDGGKLGAIAKEQTSDCYAKTLLETMTKVTLRENLQCFDYARQNFDYKKIAHILNTYLN